MLAETRAIRHDRRVDSELCRTGTGRRDNNRCRSGLARWRDPTTPCNPDPRKSDQHERCRAAHATSYFRARNHLDAIRTERVLDSLVIDSARNSPMVRLANEKRSLQ